EPVPMTEVDEGAEVELRAGVPVEVERAIGQLVAEPGDVGGDGGAARGLELEDAILPRLAGQPEVVHLPADQDARLAVHQKLSAFDGHHLSLTSREALPYRVSAGAALGSLGMAHNMHSQVA